MNARWMRICSGRPVWMWTSKRVCSARRSSTRAVLREGLPRALAPWTVPSNGWGISPMGAEIS